MFTFLSSYVALWALVLFQGLLILALLQQLAKLRNASLHEDPVDDQLPDGSRAPEFANLDKSTRREFGVQSLGEKGGVILFLSSQCHLCNSLVDSLEQFALGDLPAIIAFCKGREQPCARFAKRLALKLRLVFDTTGETGGRYHVSTFPTAVAVDGQLRIRGYAYPKDIGEIQELWLPPLLAALTR